MSFKPKPPMVVVRVRPANKREIDEARAFASKNNSLDNRLTYIQYDQTGTMISCQPPASQGINGKAVNPARTEWRKFNRVFDPNTTQEQFYTDVAGPYIDDALQDGQTGSGKTFSLAGDLSIKKSSSTLTSAPNAGVTPRAIIDLFQKAKDHPDFTYKFKCGYIEIDGEEVRDLMKSPATKITNIKDAIKTTSLYDIESPEQALNHIITGSSRRMVANTAMNAQSSRSHACFTVHIYGMPKNGSDSFQTYGLLNFLDLAGSERQGKTNISDAKQKEQAVKINMSLTTLNKCIKALSGTKTIPPFRESKLTIVLQELIRAGQICLLIAASPSLENQNETANSVQFGADALALPAPSALEVQKADIIDNNLRDIYDKPNIKRQKLDDARAQELVQLQKHCDVLLEQSFQRNVLVVQLYHQLRALVGEAAAVNDTSLLVPAGDATSRFDSVYD